ncbi:putative decarboxylase tpcK [Hypsizygus marmoreus]|uniref:Decarboxylase tpcK n=1 Tax=Hypsizygus marmoreus TaxID=39966 RepID=A0A369K823_HYPMA|nr:putative decarboxylase tpcK [Hypsizygus marmoreus]
MSNTSRHPIVLMGYVKRLPSLTPEEFYKYWETVHAPLVVPWVLKHGITDYRQVHTPQSLRSALTPSAMEYDGYGQLTAQSLEDIQAALQDPYYAEVIEPDERRFIDKSAAMVTAAGHQVDILKGGEDVRRVEESTGGK